MLKQGFKENASTWWSQPRFTSEITPLSTGRTGLDQHNDGIFVLLCSLTRCRRLLAFLLQNVHVFSSVSPRERERAARCCGRCGASCCWSWSPSCRAHAAHTSPTTATRKAARGTRASGRSTWWRPAPCSDSTALWWGLPGSGRSSRVEQLLLSHRLYLLWRWTWTLNFPLQTYRWGGRAAVAVDDQPTPSHPRWRPLCLSVLL